MKQDDIARKNRIQELQASIRSVTKEARQDLPKRKRGETDERHKARVKAFIDALVAPFRDEIALLRGQPLPSGRQAPARYVYGTYVLDDAAETDVTPLQETIAELAAQKERLWEEVCWLHGLLAGCGQEIPAHNMFVAHLDEHWYDWTPLEIWTAYRNGELSDERVAYLLGISVKKVPARFQAWNDEIPF